MARDGGEWYYAEIVNAQINPNLTPRINWTKIGNAVGHTTQYATSEFHESKIITGYKTKTTGTGKKKKTTKTPVYKTYDNYPWTVTGHQFGITLDDLPNSAYITEARFRVKMKKSNDASVEFPRGLLCIYGDGFRSKIDNTKGKETGWHNGLYLFNPKKKLSKSSWTTCDYILNESNIKKGKFKAKDFRHTMMGIDLIFDDVPKKDCKVYLQYIAFKVSYELPSYTIEGSIPSILRSGVEYTSNFKVRNNTRGYGGNQTVYIRVPWGTKVTSIRYNGNQSAQYIGEDNKGTKTYACPNLNFDGKKEYPIVMSYIDYTVNTQTIEIGNDIMGYRKYDYTTLRGDYDDYDETVIQVDTVPHAPHKRHRSCFKVSSKATSSDDDYIIYYVKNNKAYTLDCVKLEETFSSVDVTLDKERLAPYIGKDYEANEEVPVYFHVNEDSVDEIVFTYCIRPHVEGENIISVRTNNNPTSLSYEVLPPLSYHFGNKTVDTEDIENNILRGEELGFRNHRIATQLETGAYVLPCRVKEFDSMMFESKPSIHMYKWEQIDYIGCVPIEHHHFDPKSTYKDKLLDSHYKNKRYMGKELAPDEDISLNIRLHPHQVTTIQGLIDMDKPIPINANHLCFEGDALNHRGWCEIYGIKSEETNPHWYKCDIDVKYLTHNLNTRFKIDKGDKTFPYPIPTLLLESSSSGDALSGENQESEYFNIDTDGTYHYTTVTQSSAPYIDEDNQFPSKFKDEDNKVYYRNRDYDESEASEQILKDIEAQGYDIISSVANGDELTNPIIVDTTFDADNNQRNIFTLDEGQHFLIKSNNTLSSTSRVAMTWSSTLLTELKENSVSRVVSLVDKKTGTAMFEYEYDLTGLDTIYKTRDSVQDPTGKLILEDLTEIECHVIGRKYDNGDYETVIDENIRLAVDDDTSDFEEDESELDFRRTFGSTISFTLKDKTLQVVDTGYMGKEIDKTISNLQGDEYYWQTKWVNKNTDGEDADILCYVDIVAQDNLFNSQYSDLFGDMYVSPFPVANKRILFTREAEEGIIYYIQGNSEDESSEFSYIIEPYYQYHNGVDLRTSDGTSIFNLNYGYKTVYLENGLVSFGINRITGQMYLRKWDNSNKEYVPMYTFQLDHYDDVNINCISDDYIELQASDTTIGMYRGHPYVVLRHRGEDIKILSKFTKVYGESVNTDTPSDYPTYWDLMNNQNLLSECVGSKTHIKKDCLTVDENILHLEDVEISVNTVGTDRDGVDTIYNNESAHLSVDGVDTGLVYFVVDGTVVGSCDASESLPYTFTESGEHQVYAVFVGNDTQEYDVSDTHLIFSKQFVDDTPYTPQGGGTVPTPPPELSGEWELTMISCPKTMYYMDNTEIKARLTRGGTPVKGITIERVAFNNIFTGETDKDGYISFRNEYTTTTPKSYQIGFRFFYDKNMKTPKCEVMKKVTVKKANTGFKLVHGAKGRTDRTCAIKMYNASSPNEYNRVNKKVTVHLNGGKAVTKTTNSLGNIFVKVPKGKVYKIKVEFAGTSNYNKKTFTFSEKQ